MTDGTPFRELPLSARIFIGLSLAAFLAGYIAVSGAYFGYWN